MSDPVLSGNEARIPVAPEFFVRDFDASLRFYRERLGFRIVREEPGFAVIARDDAYVLLAMADETAPGVREWLASGPRGVGMNTRIMLDGIDELYQSVSSDGVTVVQEIGDREYGLRDFMISDPDGFLLRFASPIRR